MRNLSCEGARYAESSPSGLGLAKCVRLLLQQAGTIAPNAFLVPFKCAISDGAEQRRAHLAAISCDYSRWSVIHIEFGAVDLSRVLPQLRALKNGFYEKYHARYLVQRDSRLYEEKLAHMIVAEPPSIVLLGDRRVSKWNREIAGIGGKAVALEIYHSDQDQYALILDGSLLSAPEDLAIVLQQFDIPSRLLRTPRADLLPISRGERLTALFDNMPVQLERLDAGGANAILRTVGAVALDPGARYRLIRSTQGYTLERIGRP